MRGISWVVAGSVIGLLSGCFGDLTPDAGGGGGPVAPSPVAQIAPSRQSDEEAILTRDYVGNAYMAASRAHRATAQGNYRAARNDLADVRRSLAFAAVSAAPDQKAEIQEVLAKLKALETETTDHDPRAVVSSRQLVEGLLWLFDSYAGFGPGGGAGKGL